MGDAAGGGSNANWLNSRTRCQALGGDLVVYESYEEQSLVGGWRPTSVAQ
jgi:hypothetical protein